MEQAVRDWIIWLKYCNQRGGEEEEGCEKEEILCFD